MKKKPVARLGRPPKGAVNVERLLKNGKWIKDDGKPGVAFSGQRKLTGKGCSDMPFPFAWANFDIEHDWDACAREAMSYTCRRFGGANGEQFVVPRKRKK
jgi:hypothetical protein